MRSQDHGGRSTAHGGEREQHRPRAFATRAAGERRTLDLDGDAHQFLWDIAARIAAGMLSNPSRGHATVKDAMSLFDHLIDEMRCYLEISDAGERIVTSLGQRQQARNADQHAPTPSPALLAAAAAAEVAIGAATADAEPSAPGHQHEQPPYRYDAAGDAAPSPPHPTAATTSSEVAPAGPATGLARPATGYAAPADGDGERGCVPQLGQTASDHWLTTVPAPQMPGLFDPAAGLSNEGAPPTSSPGHAPHGEIAPPDSFAA